MFNYRSFCDSKKNLTLCCFFIGSFILYVNVGTINATGHREKIFRLICETSGTIDDKGKFSETTGKYILTIIPQEDGKVAVWDQRSGKPFIGRILEEEITGFRSEELNNGKLEESIDINRFTGEINKSYGIKGKGRLIHIGSCKLVTSQLF